MKLGIIGAMEVEVTSLRAAMKNRRDEQVGEFLFMLGEIEGVSCVLVRSGIGKVAAAVATQTMILKYAPDLIVNTGVAGALSSRLTPGDIVISENAVQYDMDTSPLGDPVGMVKRGEHTRPHCRGKNRQGARRHGVLRRPLRRIQGRKGQNSLPL